MEQEKEVKDFANFLLRFIPMISKSEWDKALENNTMLKEDLEDGRSDFALTLIRVFKKAEMPIEFFFARIRAEPYILIHFKEEGFYIKQNLNQSFGYSNHTKQRTVGKIRSQENSQWVYPRIHLDGFPQGMNIEPEEKIDVTFYPDSVYPTILIESS